LQLIREKANGRDESSIELSSPVKAKQANNSAEVLDRIDLKA